MSKATNSLKEFTAKLKAFTGALQSQKIMKLLGQEAVRLVVVRTRLGYMVDRNGGERRSHKPLSSKYVEFRRKAKNLSDFTSPKRSNLTFTGQMLSSMKIVSVSRGSCIIGPQGKRTDSKGKNDAIAAYLIAMGRPFNHLSRLETEQLFRYFRRQFGDLARSERLTFNPG